MSNILILGAAGFIGTNLILKLAKNSENYITAVDKEETYFYTIKNYEFSNVKYIVSSLTESDNYSKLVKGQDVVYHLVSTTVPSTSNQCISEEIKSNVVLSANLFEACVQQCIKRVVFISSGGTVYGNESACPLREETPTNPITSYGVQKVTIEKLLYLFSYMYDLDYRIIRLANPYGPFQRPNGVIGAITTFTYKALKGEEIQVYGDGSIVRDYIYIDDAITSIIKIANSNVKHRTFNLGCGYGTSINDILNLISKTLNLELNIKYLPGRVVDVPVNYLDMSRYEMSFGKLHMTSLEDGIKRTAKYLIDEYGT